MSLDLIETLQVDINSLVVWQSRRRNDAHDSEFFVMHMIASNTPVTQFEFAADFPVVFHSHTISNVRVKWLVKFGSLNPEVVVFPRGIGDFKELGNRPDDCEAALFSDISHGQWDGHFDSFIGREILVEPIGEVFDRGTDVIDRVQDQLQGISLRARDQVIIDRALAERTFEDCDEHENCDHQHHPQRNAERCQ